MGQPLRVLLLEDSEDDADLLLHQLRRGGYEPAAQRFDSAESFTAALERKDWDVVISDYVMPGFGGLEALELFKQSGQDIPFIIVSGHIGEEVAVAALKAGAHDYVMKDRLVRLGPAIKRALQETWIARAHRAANDALRENEERFRQLAENIGAVFFMFERPAGEFPGVLSYVSPAYRKTWGSPCESLFTDASSWLKAIHNDDRLRVQHSWARMAETNLDEEFRIVLAETQVRWIHFRTFTVRNGQGSVYRVAAIAEDVTERKHVEQELAANACRLEKTVQDLRAIEEELRNSNFELSLARTELEQRVQQRTAALSAANAELLRQMEERRRLENELLEIAENERRRIGFDLHDDIGQKLMGVSLLLKAVETNLRHQNLPQAAEIGDVQALVGQVINHTHDLAQCFSSLESESSDLGVLLKKLAANIRRTFHIDLQFHAPAESPVLSSEVVLQLYKIAQEALSNAVKHGKASHINLSLEVGDGRLQLMIENDGVPFPTDYQPTNRMGLRIMNYRAHTIGGTLEISPRAECGTRVMCSLPYANGHARQNVANRRRESLAEVKHPTSKRQPPEKLQIPSTEVAPPPF